jgi:alpha-tubulin suppressor-like RCC1 family protein
VLLNGSVTCWGHNQFGQIGNHGTATGRYFTQENLPAPVTGISGGVIAISGGGFHTCAVFDSGGIKCWGGGWFGQLGNGAEDDRGAPVDVVGIDGTSAAAAAVVAGNEHSCALLRGGQIKCWGTDDSGQLGDGGDLWFSDTQSVPVDVIGIP